jgi:endonuclease-3 related protein
MTEESASMDARLEEVYRRLYAHFGPQHWWPGKSALQVILGAILTQNTAWTNVERALANLKRAGLLQVGRLHEAREPRLAALIRPSGYYHLKARKLKAFTRFLFEKHHGRLSHLFRLETGVLREELLGVYGIGPETADSIILYAAKQPIFVVDAYTRRITARLGLAHPDASYEDLQRLFMDHLPRAEPLFNEYHALLVALGKNYCVKSAPRCGACPLREVCPTGRPRTADSRPE